MNPNAQPQLEGTQLSGFTPAGPVTQLEILDTVPGTGDEVKPGDTITAHYTGALVATGVIFQSSHDRGEPVTFGLNQVIKGWTEGVPGMKVGGTRRLLIPAAMAYGSASPAPNIPPNSDLVFDIELIAIPSRA
jgi:peptidylprolyl isomerase